MRPPKAYPLGVPAKSREDFCGVNIGGAVQFSFNRAVHGERYRDRSGGDRDGRAAVPAAAGGSAVGGGGGDLLQADMT